MRPRHRFGGCTAGGRARRMGGRGGGAIVGGRARTDSLGEARARWTLGPRAGSQQALCRWARRAPCRGRARGDGDAGAGRYAGARSERLAPRHRRARRSHPRSNFGSRDRQAIPCRASRSRCGRRAGRSPSGGGHRLDGTGGGGLDARAPRPACSASRRRRRASSSARSHGASPAAAAPAKLVARGRAGRRAGGPAVAAAGDRPGDRRLRQRRPGALVVFSSRSGKLTRARARTDSAGRAVARWALGPAAGHNRGARGERWTTGHGQGPRGRRRSSATTMCVAKDSARCHPSAARDWWAELFAGKIPRVRSGGQMAVNRYTRRQ